MTDLPGRSRTPSTHETGLVQAFRASVMARFGRRVPHIVVGYSAGGDSLALSLIVAGLVRAGAMTATLAHVDHGVRPTSSEAADTAASVAAELGLPINIVRLTQEDVAAHAGAGQEEALRRERYRALAGVVASRGGDAVALAHHERDQAETILLHLARGAGLDGVAGMRSWSELPVPWWPEAGRHSGHSLPVWRPLLRVPYDQIRGLADSSGLPIAEDETNEDVRFRRNAIRHEALPVLERIFPGATGAIARFGATAADDADILGHLTLEAFEACSTGETSLARGALQEYPVALRRRVIRHWLRAFGVECELSSNRLDAVLHALDRNRSGAVVQIGAGWNVAFRRGELVLEYQ